MFQASPGSLALRMLSCISNTAVRKVLLCLEGEIVKCGVYSALVSYMGNAESFGKIQALLVSWCLFLLSIPVVTLFQ